MPETTQQQLDVLDRIKAIPYPEMVVTLAKPGH